MQMNDLEKLLSRQVETSTEGHTSAGYTSESNTGLVNTTEGLTNNDGRVHGNLSYRQKPPRNRVLFQFFTDQRSRHERDISNALLELRKGRRFKKTVLAALDLYFSLEERRIDVLLALFPYLAPMMKDEYLQQ